MTFSFAQGKVYALDEDLGYVVVTKGQNVGVVDGLGKTILPLIYSDIFKSNDHLIVYDGNNYGAFDLNGKQIMPLKFDYISLISEGKALVLSDLKEQQVSSKNQAKIWRVYDLEKLEGNFTLN